MCWPDFCSFCKKVNLCIFNFFSKSLIKVFSLYFQDFMSKSGRNEIIIFYLIFISLFRHWFYFHFNSEISWVKFYKLNSVPSPVWVGIWKEPACRTSLLVHMYPVLFYQEIHTRWIGQSFQSQNIWLHW